MFATFLAAFFVVSALITGPLISWQWAAWIGGIGGPVVGLLFGAVWYRRWLGFHD
ncbi:hypothetical protein [Amycolatopsis anabasis]|uniref:hypothetical protein n=1 Tax=Amycolatopsis anabasis TaxID=1840409 RepID=UPI00131C43DE|nr:hypothetical protein [Amycolatopsis anabasis]